jgi:hypothetical protein
MGGDPQVLCSRQLAVGGVVWPDGRRTVFVKLTLEPTSEGALVLSAEQRDASLDITGAHGEVLVPSDFAPYKPACDVVVIERSAAARAEPGTLIVGGARFDVGPRESLGPRAIFCPDGNPNDPESEALWSGPRGDFNRFQAAEPQRRLPFPQPPLDLLMQRGHTNVRWRFTGPVPRGYQLTRDASAVEFALPLALDTVLLDPAEARVVLLFRGVLAARADGITVIDASWERSLDVGRFRAFTPIKPVSPHTVARGGLPPLALTGASHDDETRALSGVPLSAALPFAPRTSVASSQPPSSARAAAEDATIAAVHTVAIEPTRAAAAHTVAIEPTRAAAAHTVAIEQTRAADSDGKSPRTRASTLPFAPSRTRDAASRRKLSAAELAALREQPAPSSPWGQDETHALARPPLAPPPIELAPPPIEPAPLRAPSAPPERVAAILPQLGYVPSTTGPSALTEAHRAEPRQVATSTPVVEEVTPAQIVADVQKEIWKATEPLAAILARRGLTEAQWRELKKQAKGR